MNMVSIKSVSKRYVLRENTPSYATVRDLVSSFINRHSHSIQKSFLSSKFADSDNSIDSTACFWALKNVSFEVNDGEVVGLVGRNGSGKSTLLKIISKITRPTTGSIELNGRVGSLLEVGTGFHHELTGRENIFLAGAILGMSRHEINLKFDDIVGFAEISRFLDTPVKRYSSGMYVRLAFAVAAHLEPEILIIDEVLAVGDAEFQRKCLSKIKEVSRSGRTILFVSHNLAAVINLCNKVAVLDRGQLRFFGPTDEGVQTYLNNTECKLVSEVDLRTHQNRRPGSKPLMETVKVADRQGKPRYQFLPDEEIQIEVHFSRDSCPRNVQVGVGFEDETGRRLFTVASYLSKQASRPNHSTEGLRCHLPELALAPGRYAVSINAGPPHSLWDDFIDQAIWIDIHPADFYKNGRLPNPDWGTFLARSLWEQI